DGGPPRLDRSLTIVTDYYQVEGTIQDVGGVESFSRSEVTAVLLVEDVHESIASGFEEGMTKQVGDEMIVEVTAVDSEPSTIVRVTDDGEVVVAEHPTERDVTFTLTLQGLDTPNGTEFVGQRLRQGETVTIHLDRMTIEGRIVTLE
ncbi:MAG: DUF4330 domain-containing protein, partial [Natronomonas sp.]